MTRRYLKLAIAGCLFTLTACAQQSEIRQMHQSVSTLSQEMTQLNQQTIKITQQNALNAKSTRGVYLLPEAKTPARLESQIGTLRMSVGSITLSLIHISEPTRLGMISYAVFCLKKKKPNQRDGLLSRMPTSA